MAREILFRGKRASEWHYGHFFAFRNDGGDTGAHFIIEQESEDVNVKSIQVMPDTIGQFTGLRDKNSKEIYEGDIIYSEFADKSNTHLLVGWNEKESCFGTMDEYSYRSKLEGYDYPQFENLLFRAFLKDSKIFEVRGNIYDNPELLKED